MVLNTCLLCSNMFIDLLSDGDLICLRVHPPHGPQYKVLLWSKSGGAKSHIWSPKSNSWGAAAPLAPMIWSIRPTTNHDVISPCYSMWMSLIPYSMVSEAQYIQSKWLQAKYLSLSLNNIKVHISMLTSITVCKQYESLVNARSIYFPMQRSSLHQRSVALSYNLQMLDCCSPHGTACGQICRKLEKSHQKIEKK